MPDENDATCPRCGNHRPHGCLCHIPIPKTYTREDMAQAWDEGYDARGEDIANEGLVYTELTPNPYSAIPPERSDDA